LQRVRDFFLRFMLHFEVFDSGRVRKMRMNTRRIFFVEESYDEMMV